MEKEDLALGMLIWVLEEDLTIDSSGSDEGWIQSIYLVGGHNHFDISSVIETVQLIKKFQHGTLNFTFSTRG